MPTSSSPGRSATALASHAGEDREPPCWLHLREAGEVEVPISGERFRVRAREAHVAERERS